MPGSVGMLPGLLGGDWRPGAGEARRGIGGLFGLLVLGGLLYGACMGSWEWRPKQQLYSSLKTPLLISLGSLFCLPSFFVVNTILGLREDFKEALLGILMSQVTLAVCLASFGPILLVLYSGTGLYPVATTLNGAMFFMASLCGQLVLARRYRVLRVRNPKHSIALVVWLVTYWFVTIQLAWMLRPFIGRPGDPTTFLREETWGNAYVHIWKMLSRLF